MIICYYFPHTITGDFMCEILKKLNGKTASELLKEYNIPLSPPIDISLLLSRIGISEIPSDFTEIENILNYRPGDILGIIYAKNNKLGIFYRETDSINRKRFTMAHEIAHCCLHSNSLEERHIELRNANTEYDEKEMDANIFAGELLIPRDVLIGIHRQFLVAPPLSTLSKIFCVSTNVMAARLDYLNMPYIKDTTINEN